MAKFKERKNNPGFTITTKTPYGSTSDMIVKTDGDVVTCRDDKGEYTTTLDRIDTGLADPNRWIR
jgi:hypothetical protein